MSPYYMLICGIEPKLDRTKKCQLRNVDREAKERGMAKKQKTRGTVGAQAKIYRKGL